MGDRANVAFLDEDRVPIYFYSHWGGEALPGLVREVLARKQRWDDPTYLARMIFSKMVSDDIDGETGYGISLSMPDNEHRIIVVNCTGQFVGFADPGQPTTPVKKWTFEEYISILNFEQDVLSYYQEV